MGAGASSMEGSVQQQIGLGDLPESCVAEVLRRLEPLEICRLARLSRAFRGAAAADFVWETKLPGNYQCLMEKAKDGKDSQHGLSKKEIYARLCRPNPFDGGTKEFWLDKCGGGICISISSKALSITGINDRRCWKYISTEESRNRLLETGRVIFMNVGNKLWRVGQLHSVLSHIREMMNPS